ELDKARRRIYDHEIVQTGEARQQRSDLRALDDVAITVDRRGEHIDIAWTAAQLCLQQLRIRENRRVGNSRNHTPCRLQIEQHGDIAVRQIQVDQGDAAPRFTGEEERQVQSDGGLANAALDPGEGDYGTS